MDQVNMSLFAFVKEHKKLIKLLTNVSKLLIDEADEQQKELNKVIKKKRTKQLK